MATATLSPLVLPAILGPLSIATNLVVLGAHVMVPWRLADEGELRRRSWALVALPLLLLATLLGLLRFALEPDRLLAGGFDSPLWTAPSARALGLLMLTLLLTDALLLMASRRLERSGWKLAAGVGLAALIGFAYFAEALSGLDDGAVWHLARAALRAGTSVGLGMALLPVISSRSPALAAAAVAAILYLPLLPRDSLLDLWGSGELLFAVVGAVLLFAPRLLPHRPAGGTSGIPPGGHRVRISLLLAALALGCFWSRVAADPREPLVSSSQRERHLMSLPEGTDLELPAVRLPLFSPPNVVNVVAAHLDLPALRKLQLLAEPLPERALSVLGILRARQKVLDLLRPYRHLAAAAEYN